MLNKTYIKILNSLFVVIITWMLSGCSYSINETPIPVENIKKNVVAVYNSLRGENFSTNSLTINGEVSLSEEDIKKILSEDNTYINLETEKKSPIQRFDITLPSDTATDGTLRLKWNGQANRLVQLQAWDYSSQQWVKLNIEISRSDKNLSLTAVLDKEKMLKDEHIQILTSALDKNTPLPGKVPKNNEYDFTFAWLSDTQYYSANYPKIYDRLTQYIVDKRQEKKIAYAIHTGDIVDWWETIEQWNNADHSMSILDKAGLPYGVVAGNHDAGWEKYDYDNYGKYFGEKRFAGRPYYGGTPNNNRDHYDLINAGDKKYIIVYLGWGVESASLEWANKILGQNKDREAIIALHAFISSRGTYSYQAQDVVDKLVKNNENVFMVLCGHYPGTAYNVKQINNRTVYEMLSDYQAIPEGGLGYFRMLQFDTKNGLIYVNTYSPYLDDYNYFEAEKEQFILPLLPETGPVKISTDYIGVEIG